jgi:hypothetical protein
MWQVYLFERGRKTYVGGLGTDKFLSDGPFYDDLHCEVLRDNLRDSPMMQDMHTMSMHNHSFCLLLGVGNSIICDRGIWRL